MSVLNVKFDIPIDSQEIADAIIQRWKDDIRTTTQYYSKEDLVKLELSIREFINDQFLSVITAVDTKNYRKQESLLKQGIVQYATTEIVNRLYVRNQNENYQNENC